MSASPLALETPGAANSRKYGSDLAMNARLPKRGCNSSRSASIASGSPTVTIFVVGCSIQSASGPTMCIGTPATSE